MNTASTDAILHTNTGTAAPANLNNVNKRAQEIARLSGELGYAAEASQLAERLCYFTEHNDNIVYVADAGGPLLGWIHAEVRFLIESPPLWK
ncbi:hypothetical protein [Paenibacillus jilunlii]|uniref:Uncharacterized protein n=1 Tax=Paenibacillus jilunlii TaxID=682956 RepID=A0A1G9KYF5_9BACL|nr:hypothetical protein [Paenibacillus jilunlii]SDL54890.1 hypothetical protein SAMN05216191_103440 [Paenibacillus jilunlii]